MMSEDSKEIAVISPKQLLRKNPNVSKSVVVQYSRLEKQLKNLGVDTKPRYTLSPPLGGNVLYLRRK